MLKKKKNASGSDNSGIVFKFVSLRFRSFSYSHQPWRLIIIANFVYRCRIFVQRDGVFQVAPERGGSSSTSSSATKNTLRISNQTLGTFRGGSLPNVSAGTPTVKTATHIKDTNKVILLKKKNKKKQKQRYRN